MATERSIPYQNYLAGSPPSLVIRILSFLFGGPSNVNGTSTSITVNATLEDTWRNIRFYEEVPGRAPFPLRAFMPCPIRTVGSKHRVGSAILCIYERGSLIKRITVVHPPERIEFDVSEQFLGIEKCIVAQYGSYALAARGNRTEISLTTEYRSYLHPRWIWRPLEEFILGQLHHHVLNGVREVVTRNPAAKPLIAEV